MILSGGTITKTRQTGILRAYLAGVERIELPSAVLETDVLPLYDTPNKNGD